MNKALIPDMLQEWIPIAWVAVVGAIGGVALKAEFSSQYNDQRLDRVEDKVDIKLDSINRDLVGIREDLSKANAYLERIHKRLDDK